MGKLEKKRAIVTGATSGMGRAIAECFADEGASVVLGGRNLIRGAEVTGAIRKKGGKAQFVAGDVGEITTNELLVKKAVDAFNGVDIIVANAGMLGLGSITDLTPEAWHETVAVNLNAVYYILHLGIPEMLKNGGGTIVITGTVAAYKGFPNHAAYCASKGGLVPLVKQVAIDYGPEIRINMVSPGPVDTPLIHASAAAFPDPDEIVRKTGEGVPLGRLGTPLDIAKAALFLASDDSSWITGTSLVIDGGALSIG